jgi:hypothetical protein
LLMIIFRSSSVMPCMASITTFSAGLFNVMCAEAVIQDSTPLGRGAFV